MRAFGHKRPIRDDAGEIIGSNRGKRLIVSLEEGDLVVIRIEKSPRKTAIAASSIFRWMLQCEANRRHADARLKKKDRKAARLAAQRQARAEKRLFKKEKP